MFLKIPLPFKLCNLSIDPLLKKRSPVTIYSWIIAIFQFSILGGIIIIHSKLVSSLTKSQKQLKPGTKREKSLKPLIRQIVALTVSCVLCWVPVNLMSLSVQFMDRYSIEMVIWATVIAGSTNSMVYPMILGKFNFSKFRQFLCIFIDLDWMMHRQGRIGGPLT